MKRESYSADWFRSFIRQRQDTSTGCEIHFGRSGFGDSEKWDGFTKWVQHIMVIALGLL